MEKNVSHGGGGMCSGMGSAMLGLELPLHPQQQQQQQQQQQEAAQNPVHLHQIPQMISYDHHHPHSQQSLKQATYTYATTSSSTRAKQQPPLSDEDEPGGGDDGTSDGKRKMSPWQRMKWTDHMVRLLILAVFYIGDEAGGGGGSEANDKKKGGALLQKKGKWKSVSRAMMEKGFYVSPQQCEDKFNDLNKRYKRVNEILGRGTSCKVVENQSLLETMDLSPKLKEEVKKLLNSKHLFFREMCAYHNSCGHGSGGTGSGTNQSSEMAADHNHIQHQLATQQQQQRCSHSTEKAQFVANSRAEMEGSRMAKRVGTEEEDDEDDDDDDDDDESDEDDADDDEDEDEDDAIEGHSGGKNGHGQENEDDHEEKPSRKRPRTGEFCQSSTLTQQLSVEIMSVIQDVGKSAWEKKQWMRLRLMQLEEQHVSYQYQALDLDRQMMKWMKFSFKKERDMKRAKLENERQRLENERMVLLLRQKEIELSDLQHQSQQQHSSNKQSCIT